MSESLYDELTIDPDSVVAGAAFLGNGVTLGANSLVRNDVDVGAILVGAPNRPSGATG